ncbi:hypothetical protein EA772_15940 [Pedobacter sp. G11]|uniref:cytochrome b/b6 domain-containing protein n=1 Tax=Pedobacter sp. G11 TaxID=2482728 RepID=UPI000F5F094B|nr:hypothetical protein EA772_15940 [Pedobacter sp. G11]
MGYTHLFWLCPSCSFSFQVNCRVFYVNCAKTHTQAPKSLPGLFYAKKEHEAAKHELVVKGLYLIFYLLLCIMVLTGLLLAFEDYTGIPENINHRIKEFHGFCMYLILGLLSSIWLECS